MAGKYGLTPQGPNPKRLDVILDEMHASLTERLGINTKQNPESLLNHLLTNVADKIAEVWEYATDVYYSQYPSSATGISLDYAAEFGGSTRELPAKSYYHILCTGIDGTVIPAGTIIATDTNPPTRLSIEKDAEITRANFSKATVIITNSEPDIALGIALNGTLYSYTPDGEKSLTECLEGIKNAITDEEFKVTVKDGTLVIEAVDEASMNVMVLSENLTTLSVGSIVMFGTEENGNILIPNGVISKIVKSVAGLQSVRNVGSYISGQLQESDEAFRLSYADKIFNRSSNMLESIRSAILTNVQGIISVAVYENDSNVVDKMGRPPHSVEVVCDGGDETQIAQQILDTKAGGISTHGSVEIELAGIYGEPITIRFNRPKYIRVWFKIGVTMSKSVNPPTNYVELIKAQITDYVGKMEAGDSVIPQKMHLEVSGIDYMDIWLFSADDETAPGEYDKRVVEITARERAVTDDSRIEVVLDG